MMNYLKQVHCRHSAHQVRPSQEPQTGLVDHRSRVGHFGGHRFANCPRFEQHGASHIDRLRFLQRRFRHLFVTVVILHPLHHHGLPLLSNLQGSNHKNSIFFFHSFFLFFKLNLARVIPCDKTQKENIFRFVGEIYKKKKKNGMRSAICNDCYIDGGARVRARNKKPGQCFA